MQELGASDLRAIRAVAERLTTVATRASLPAEVVSGLHSLIGCDVATYEELEPGQSMVRVSDPASHDFPELEPVFLDHLAEHPMIAHFRATGDATPYRFSDFLSDRELHALPLYAEVLRHIDVERQTGFSVTSHEAVLTGVTLSRGAGRDFSQRDLTVLDLLRPTVELARETVRLRAVLSTVADKPATSAVVVLDDHHRITWASPLAREILEAHYGDVGATLPEELRAFIERAAARGMPDVAERNHPGRGRISVRFLPAATAGELPSLVLDETGTPTVERLKAHGLSTREAEVLALLTRGLTNQQIAEELYLSAGTVRTHVGRIFSKLGVHSRAEAAWIAAHPRPESQGNR